MVAFDALHATHRMAMPVDMIVEAIDRRHVTTLERFEAPWNVARFVPDPRVGRVLASVHMFSSGHMAGHHD
ncbi:MULTISPECIES: hypothetical protein [Mycobacteriaceae]|uniref:Uncharacterized protein n=2 Tax=Mycolicibacterium TaxID=1866885 RepID=A0AAW5SEC1_MYCNV|nr:MULTISPECIES: hypothetical protein [Mycobacteriaceae]MCV7022020.1 hypothetical protein [Mycolicibacterium novocastrense]MCV7057552.1 hypothetical protein [Mycolicibacterium gilvum]MDV3134411.1 hypothetical protein [Mycobacterium sp. 29Ha]STZ44410.1 Uncharacterised protein [Mycolicibacterium gilvum]GAT07392.1 putative uncharacterized protein [Mycolicibacterium novocastrense]